MKKWNYRRFTYVLGVFLIIALGNPMNLCQQDAGRIIRVHLLSTDSAKIGAEGNLSLCDGDKVISSCHSGNTFSMKDGKIYIGDDPTSMESFFLKSENGIIYVNNKPYRGKLEIKKRKPGSFIVVNWVDIEDYLAGVLGGEVSAYWPMEALKAQAVAARSYIMSKKRQPRDKDFDAYSTVMDQVYIGQQAELPKLLDAVRDTSGQVMTYDDNVIKAYFHSTCGGHTEDGAEVFPEDASFLKGVSCPYCKDSPCYSWELDLTTDDLTKAFNKNGSITSEIFDFAVTRWDDSERAAEIAIGYNNGEKFLKGSEVRLIIGPGKLKSTRFKMSVAGEKTEEIIKTNIIWRKRPPQLEFFKDLINLKSLTFAQFNPVYPAVENSINHINIDLYFDDFKDTRKENDDNQDDIKINQNTLKVTGNVEVSEEEQNQAGREKTHDTEEKNEVTNEAKKPNVEKPDKYDETENETKAPNADKSGNLSEKAHQAGNDKLDTDEHKDITAETEGRESAIPVRIKPEILIERIDIREKVEATYHFKGRGWGHGVGLCQWGAYFMAKQGFSYSDILKYYYPGTELKKISESN